MSCCTAVQLVQLEMWAISDALPHEAAQAPSSSACQVSAQSSDERLSYCHFTKLHHGSQRGVVGTLPNCSWTQIHHRPYMLLNGFKKYCFVSNFRNYGQKRLKNREKIELNVFSLVIQNFWSEHLQLTLDHYWRQGLNYFQRGVGALPIQWPMVEICELLWNAKICDFMQVIIAVIQQQSISFKLEKNLRHSFNYTFAMKEMYSPM